MKFPEEQYYRLNRILLSLIGLWPYDNTNLGQFQVILSLMIFLSCISIQLLKLIISEYDPDLILKGLSFDFMFIQWTIKYVNFCAVMEKIKEFRKHIQNDWSILEDDQEIEIIRKHANIGRLFTIGTTILAYFGALFHISLQYIPDLLDIVVPLNKSRPRELIIVAEYFVDQQDYFYILSIHVNIGLLITTTTAVATETFSLANALHSFGMFKIASYRMERILTENSLQISTAKRYIVSYGRIIAAVDIHRRALEFSDLLKTCFGVSYLIMFIIAECSTSIYLFQIITVNLGILEICVSVAHVLYNLLFISVINFVGQEYINCENQIYLMICNTRWYNAPLKTQKLILFLLQKTTKGFQFDAGGLYNPSLEGLASAISMLFSFCTILFSMQR